jgi:hypothetical protein
LTQYMESVEQRHGREDRGRVHLSPKWTWVAHNVAQRRMQAMEADQEFDEPATVKEFAMSFDSTVRAAIRGERNQAEQWLGEWCLPIVAGAVRDNVSAVSAVTTLARQRDVQGEGDMRRAFPALLNEPSSAAASSEACPQVAARVSSITAALRQAHSGELAEDRELLASAGLDAEDEAPLVKRRKAASKTGDGKATALKLLEEEATLQVLNIRTCGTVTVLGELCSKAREMAADLDGRKDATALAHWQALSGGRQWQNEQATDGERTRQSEGDGVAGGAGEWRRGVVNRCGDVYSVWSGQQMPGVWLGGRRPGGLCSRT